MIKSSCIAVAVSVSFAVSASAGGMSEPIMEPVIVVQEVKGTTDTSGLLQWFILATVIVAATTN